MPRVTLCLSVLISIALSGCGAGSGSAKSPAAGVPGRPAKVRLGCFANVTHAQALIGAARGDFQKAIGESTLEVKIFNAGPSVVEAIFAGELDLSYVGPGPALNAYIKSISKGGDVRIISGSAANGVAVVARPGSGIQKLPDLAGKRVATPQFANTQDISAKHFLKTLGIKIKPAGETEILNIANAEQLMLFREGRIDAAWAPEPWASRLVHDAKGVLLTDEKDLWEQKRFCTVVLIVSTKFLQAYPETVQSLLKTHENLTAWINTHRDEAAGLVNQELAKPERAGKALNPAVLKDAFARTEFTTDPMPETIQSFADWSKDLGITKDAPALNGLFAKPQGGK